MGGMRTAGAAGAALALVLGGGALAQGAAAAVAAAPAGAAALWGRIDAESKALEPQMIALRRQLHAAPELGNRETKTAALVAERLRRLGYEVKTGVAGTGVVAVLKGGKPGPVVALRADMDALPVTEQTGLPFASKATGTYQGKQVGVMHACGHDTHVAMLLTAAEVFSRMKAELPGTVKLIFQPAEEGPSDFEPDGKRVWGARLMVDQGVMDAPKVDAVFGLHIFANLPAGQLAWRPGPTMASTDLLKIKVTGKQTHGANPWLGIDPIVVSSQIVLGLQTIASRQVPVTKEPSIVTVGQVHGGVRYNIIPDTVLMEGTVRAFDKGMQDDIHARITRTAEMIAASAGAKAEVEIVRQYPVTVNQPDLTARMEPTLKRVAGPGTPGWAVSDKQTGAEDFTYYGDKAPALFLFLGATPREEVGKAAANHSPLFTVDESAMLQGVRALTHMTVDYMRGGAAGAAGS